MHIQKPAAWLRYAWHALRQPLSSCPDITHYQGREIQILAMDHIPVQLDGDPAGELPMTFKILPEAVSFCLATC
jgi:diacylglycerol kinase family enzyme